MNSYKIETLEIKNFKLFDDIILKFGDNVLNILNGPNGFGKTSIFDSLELLLTGNIKRISDNKHTIGTDAFKTNVLMRIQEKDLIIKGKFRAENKIIVIIRKIEGTSNKAGKINNPQNVVSSVKTYMIQNYSDSIQNEFSPEYECEQTEIDSEIGIDNEHYNLINYIGQENRLSFLEDSKNDRLKNISSLLGISDWEVEMRNVTSAATVLTTFVKKVKKSVDDRKKKLEKLENEFKLQNKGDMEPYSQLLFWRPSAESWDIEDIDVSSLEKKNEIVRTLNNIKLFKTYYADYVDSKTNIFYKNTINDPSLKIMLALLKLKDGLDEAKLQFSNKNILKKQLEFIESSDYKKVNYARIVQILNESSMNIDEGIHANIESILKMIKVYETTETTISNSVSQLLETRKGFMASAEVVLKKENGNCPLCGYDWITYATLKENIDTVYKDFNKMVNESVQKKLEEIEKINYIFTMHFKPAILNYQQQHAYEYDDILMSAAEGDLIDTKDALSFFKKCEKLYIDLNLYQSDDLEIECANLKSDLKNMIKDISADYIAIQNKQDIDFDSINKNYFQNKKEIVDKIKVESIDKKIKFVDDKFYNSSATIIQNTKNEIVSLEKDLTIIEDKITPKLNSYKTDLKESIAIYRKRMIKDIEIPFFIFSGRIMQNYQGGLGVFIKESAQDSEGLNTIELVTPDRIDHDVLYTLSSGQLSAVVLSLTLALNKVFASNKFSYLMIDDPIQSMDELNIASFIETIRNEFSNTSIIISTHEELFAKLAKYKYNKYNLEAQLITLSDLYKSSI